MNAIINSDKLYPAEFSASDSVLGTEINLAGEWEISNNASGGRITEGISQMPADALSNNINGIMQEFKGC